MGGRACQQGGQAAGAQTAPTGSTAPTSCATSRGTDDAAGTPAASSGKPRLSGLEAKQRKAGRATAEGSRPRRQDSVQGQGAYAEQRPEREQGAAGCMREAHLGLSPDRRLLPAPSSMAISAAAEPCQHIGFRVLGFRLSGRGGVRRAARRARAGARRRRAAARRRAPAGGARSRRRCRRTARTRLRACRGRTRRSARPRARAARTRHRLAPRRRAPDLAVSPTGGGS